MNDAITPLLTPEQLAELLQIKTNTLATWRCHGVGPSFIRCGRSIRYDPAEVRKWQEEQRRTSTSEIVEQPLKPRRKSQF